MPIRYYEAPDIKAQADKIVAQLGFKHIEPSRLYCYRSKGSKSRRTIARIHSLGKLWQIALKTKAGYLIEVISERYDKLNQEEKEAL